MKNRGLSELVEGAYEAAFDETLWKPWAERLTQTLGGVGGTFFVLDNSNKNIETVIDCWGEAERLITDYVAGWWEFDPQIAATCSMTKSDIYLDTDHIDLSDLKTAEYMAWQRGNGGLDHYMSAIALLDDGQHRAGFSIHRSLADGYTPRSEQTKLSAIFPEVASALRLGFRHGDMLQTAFWNGLMVGRADQLAFLLDARGRVTRQTDAAQRLISSHDGLDISGGRLRPLRGGDDPAFHRMIGQAIDVVSPRSGAIRINRPSGKFPLILVCYPLQRKSRMLAPNEAAALLTIIDQSTKPVLRADIYRQAFNLTVRETDVAIALMGGHSVTSAAAYLDMEVPTARTHMRSLYEKTGTSGQTALMQLLTRVG